MIEAQSVSVQDGDQEEVEKDFEGRETATDLSLAISLPFGLPILSNIFGVAFRFK
jgi:hypothetical protein